MSGAIQVEQALLGALLIDNGAYAQVHGLGYKDFSEPLHGVIFKAIGLEIESGRVAAPMTIARHLPPKVVVADMDGLQYLAHLCAEAVTIKNVPDFVDVVLEGASRRKARRLLEDTLQRIDGQEGYEPEPFGRIVTEAVEGLDGIITEHSHSTVPRIHVGEAAAAAISAALEARQRGTGRAGPTWGLAGVDEYTHGMVPGSFVVAAGRPGMGKTSFGLGVALKTAAMGNGVAFVSLEMMAQDLAVRALTARAGAEFIHYTGVIGGKVDEHQERRLLRAKAELEKMPLWIEQQPGLTVTQIVSRARQIERLCRRQGKQLTCLVVDHIGLVGTSHDRQGNKVAETSDVTAGLKRAAKELGVCVIGLCQISRAAEGRDDKRPTLADLKWSGSNEEDADIVLGLYREAYYLGRERTLTPEKAERLINVQNKIEIEFLKNRQGAVGRIAAFLHVGSGTLSDWQRG